MTSWTIAATNGLIAVEVKEDRKAALDRVASRNWTFPPDYKFDRDEANERRTPAEFI